MSGTEEAPVFTAVSVDGGTVDVEAFRPAAAAAGEEIGSGVVDLNGKKYREWQLALAKVREFMAAKKKNDASKPTGWCSSRRRSGLLSATGPASDRDPASRAALGVMLALHHLSSRLAPPSASADATQVQNHCQDQERQHWRICDALCRLQR